MLGLGLKVSVSAVNKKPRTRNKHDTAGHSIFGPPSDILGGIIRTDPSQINIIFTHCSKSAKLFRNGILLCAKFRSDLKTLNVFLILKGNYSFKPLHEKAKTLVTQFYFARDSLR